MSIEGKDISIVPQVGEQLLENKKNQVLLQTHSEFREKGAHESFYRLFLDGIIAQQVVSQFEEKENEIKEWGVYEIFP